MASAEEKKEPKTSAVSAGSESVAKRQDKRGLDHDFGGGGSYGGGEYFQGIILNEQFLNVCL